jgi:hypothetical protein
MFLRKVQIHGGVREIRMTEQHLNRADVGACFEQMGSVAMAQRVRRDVFLNAGALGGLLNSFPDDLRGDRFIGTLAVLGARKQIGLGPHPSPILTQCLE